MTFVSMIISGFDFIQENRFGSYAPFRENCHASYFVDGQDYMAKVADALLEAKEEIFIADWWLSPEIYLKRGIDFDEKFRLDRILKQKAVRIQWARTKQYFYKQKLMRF